MKIENGESITFNKLRAKDNKIAISLGNNLPSVKIKELF